MRNVCQKYHHGHGVVLSISLQSVLTFIKQSSTDGTV